MVEDVQGSKVEAAFEYQLVFDDGTIRTETSKECDGTMLREGDEVFVYDKENIISRHALSPEEVRKRVRNRHIGCAVLIIVALLSIALVIAML